MNKQTEPAIILTELIHSALNSVKNRQMAKANKSFLAIYSLCREFPFILWDSPVSLDLAKSFILMHHFDTFELETENIEVAHWAYLYAYRGYVLAIESEEQTAIFDALKDLVVIADECNESYIDSVARYYLPPNVSISQSQMHDARMMASRMFPLVTYSFILQIEDRFNSFHDDEIIETTCNKIETEYGTISDKLTRDAESISKMLYAYTLKRVQSKEFVF